MKLRNPTIYTSIFFFQAVQAGFRNAPSGFGDFSYNCPIGISLHPISETGRSSSYWVRYHGHFSLSDK